jgi:hypothetical protein
MFREPKTVDSSGIASDSFYVQKGNRNKNLREKFGFKYSE